MEGEGEEVDAGEGWWATFSVVLVCVAVAAGVLLGTYRHPRTAPLALLVTYASWLVALGVVALLPLDVASTLAGVELGALPAVWSGFYWSTQALTFLVLPLHQVYEDAGDFTATARLATSLRENATMYGIGAVLSVMGVGVLAASGEVSIGGLSGQVVALSNTFGIAAGVLCLGYGLVELPRGMWRRADASVAAASAVRAVGAAASNLDDACDELLRVTRAVQRLTMEMPRTHPLRWAADQVVQQAEEDAPGVDRTGDADDDDDDYDYDELSSLVSLRRRLKRSIFALRRAKRVYSSSVVTALALEKEPRGMWRVARPILLRAGALLLAASSAVLLVAETTIWLGPDVSPVSLTLRSLRAVPVMAQLLASIMLAYLCTAMYFSLFRMRMLNIYHLVPGASDGVSLLLNAALLCRFAPPLCFNFLDLVPAVRTGARRTAFEQTIGAAVPDAFDWVNALLPLLLLPYCLMIVFNAGDRISRALGRVRSVFCCCCGGSEDDGTGLEFEMEGGAGADEKTSAGRRALADERDAARGGGTVGEAHPAFAARPAPLDPSAARARRSSAVGDVERQGLLRTGPRSDGGSSRGGASDAARWARAKERLGNAVSSAKKERSSAASSSRAPSGPASAARAKLDSIFSAL